MDNPVANIPNYHHKSALHNGVKLEILGDMTTEDDPTVDSSPALSSAPMESNADTFLIHALQEIGGTFLNFFIDKPSGKFLGLIVMSH
jgi:hypothetical protein